MAVPVKLYALRNLDCLSLVRVMNYILLRICVFKTYETETHSQLPGQTKPGVGWDLRAECARAEFRSRRCLRLKTLIVVTVMAPLKSNVEKMTGIQILLFCTPRESPEPFLALEILTQPFQNWVGHNSISSMISAEKLGARRVPRHG